MSLPRDVTENLQFLSAEVAGQLEGLEQVLQRPDPASARALQERSGYVQNLRLRISDACTLAMTGPDGDAMRNQRLRSVDAVAGELETICVLVRECVEQGSEIGDHDCLEPAHCGRMLRRVRRGVDLVVGALQEDGTRPAQKIGQASRKLDRLFSRLQAHYVRALGENRNTADLVRALFVAHGIERMGNALRNISEAILSAQVGQPLRLQQFDSLQSAMEELPDAELLGEVQIDPLVETRSGSAVTGIARAGGGSEAYLAVFKGGQKRKLKEERASVESWHALYPGLAPRVISWEKRGRFAAMLLEHLPGFTFEQLLLQDSPKLMQRSFRALTRTVQSVWSETRRDEPVAGSFMRQLEKRLDEVYRIHPEFDRGTTRICSYAQRPFADLVADCAALEAKVEAPYAVYIHGDFNVDNILYDPEAGRISFIDLHRSRYMDYVQDVSVFMVSHYRLQILDRRLRARILGVARDFHRTAEEHAQQTGDTEFPLRMALGLARSFATSTRFTLDKTLARNMFLRARYLLERVLESDPRCAADFRLPVREIFVG